MRKECGKGVYPLGWALLGLALFVMLIVVVLLSFALPARSDTAVFTAPMLADRTRPDIPPDRAVEGEMCLFHGEGDYFSVRNFLPDGRVTVEIRSSKTVIDSMKSDKKYTWVEDIPESDMSGDSLNSEGAK